jgi:hypothetical protein
MMIVCTKRWISFLFTALFSCGSSEDQLGGSGKLSGGVVVAVFDVHEFKAKNQVLGRMGHRRDF